MDLNEMLKEAQKLQKDMEDITNRLEKEEIPVSNDEGSIKISITGSGKFKALKFSDDFLKKDPRMVEKETLAVLQKSVEIAREKHEEAMKLITASLSLPSFEDIQSQAQVKGPTRRTGGNEVRYDV